MRSVASRPAARRQSAPTTTTPRSCPITSTASGRSGSWWSGTERGDNAGAAGGGRCCSAPRARRVDHGVAARGDPLARIGVEAVVAVGARAPREIAAHPVPLERLPQLGLAVDGERPLERAQHLARLVALEQEP